MQDTIHCNGIGLPNYPTDGKAVTPVKVYIHDSGMVAMHDYSCPVCRIDHAVLDLSTGLMLPCRSCEQKGYRLTKWDKNKATQREAYVFTCGILTALAAPLIYFIFT